MDTENHPTTADSPPERRQLRGSWPWFVANLILFPAPAHFTLLRVREFSLAKSLLHLGLTFTLLLILFISAGLQIVFPEVGRLWMLLPPLSGLAVVWSSRSLKTRFKPFSLTSGDPGSRLRLLLIMLVFFTVLNILPELDLIEFQDKSMLPRETWLPELPLWQNSAVFMLGTLLILLGYATNTTTRVSINRAVILYACFIMFIFQVFLVLTVMFEWLHIRGGFGNSLLAVLLAALLALDYWDAGTFGQFTRRYFLLTWTKGFSFIFLWLCLLGLPQKGASIYASYRFRHIKPVSTAISGEYLIFNGEKPFSSGHEAARRLRRLYAGALLAPSPDRLAKVSGLVAERRADVCAAGVDVCRFGRLMQDKNIRLETLSTDKVPFFRPVQPAWDVMLTALLLQETISKPDIEPIIAGFKAMLPVAAGGYLPELKTPYEARYVSLAAGTRVDFLPPSLQLVETLFENHFSPVLPLRLSGKKYWAALVSLDRSSGIAWMRLENNRRIEKSIQLLFDSGKSIRSRADILAYQLLPISLAYLDTLLANIGEPMVVFSRDGLEKALPGKISTKTLADARRSARIICRPPAPEDIPQDLTAKIAADDYLGYVQALVKLGSLFQPARLDERLFPDPHRMAGQAPRTGRIALLEAFLENNRRLRDGDRMDLAYLLALNHEASAAADLFIRLAARKPVSTDLIDCREAFTIGRRLFLLGRYADAFSYLELAAGRHPYNTEYELWYGLARLKLKKAPRDFNSPPAHQPYLYLYYQTIADIEAGRPKAALKRLEKALEKDSYDNLANHLLHKYFKRPLDETYFFPAQEGL